MPVYRGRINVDEVKNTEGVAYAGGLNIYICIMKTKSPIPFTVSGFLLAETLSFGGLGKKK